MLDEEVTSVILDERLFQPEFAGFDVGQDLLQFLDGVFKGFGGGVVLPGHGRVDDNRIG